MAPHRTGSSGRRSGSRGHHGRRRGGGPIARFIEPGVLLLLREGRAHGYELADELASFLPIQRVDVGNLYRLLRRLEEGGLVVSEWDDGESGRAKRVYELTDEGSEALDDWAERLRGTRDALSDFLERHEAGAERPGESTQSDHDVAPENEGNT